jgi:hypothetical protein
MSIVNERLIEKERYRQGYKDRQTDVLTAGDVI